MVEIIPKPVKEIPRWQTLLFYLSIILVILSIFVYFAVSSLGRSSEKNRQELLDKISQGRTNEVIALEKEVLARKDKIDEIRPYLEQHILSSQLFDFLEENAHPRTFFFEFAVSPGTSKLLVSGATDSFLSLGQQIMILDEAFYTKSVGLENVFLPPKGGIEFDLEMVLNPNIFKHHCGNGLLEQGKGEECDDGNNFGGDGCSAKCIIEEETGTETEI